jgi:glycosyltransferase involved in cell wall biosynthesis
MGVIGSEILKQYNVKISIITINYNNLEGLKRTVENVANQTWQEFDYIVIDGGSNDGSAEYIESQSQYLDYWISEPDNGIYHALNKGIKLAKGEYLLFLNSGDLLFSNDVLKKNHHHLNGTDLICFDIHVLGLGHDRIIKQPDTLNFLYLFQETFAHQSVFIKRNLFEIVGLYDESLEIVSDWKFFIHALASHHCSYKAVHETLSVFYFDGISSTAYGTFKRKEERKKILTEEFLLFYDDYKKNELLQTNRFKMLYEIESTVVGRKFVSLLFRIYIVLFSKKRLKDIIS